MDWIWDQAKAELNKQKHGVSFELAALALNDPLSLTSADPFPDEERWRTLGSPAVDGVLILFVVHTWPETHTGLGRIISARVATPRERRAYEEG